MTRNPITYERGRKSPRAAWADYARPGWYAVTICTRQRECLLGEVVAGRVALSPFGEIVAACWEELPEHFRRVRLDAFVVMPNHLHGILLLLGPPAPPQHGLPEVVRGLKGESARRINRLRDTGGATVWHRSFYDQIIRDARQLAAIRAYIVANPARWQEDEHHPAATQPSTTSDPW